METPNWEQNVKPVTNNFSRENIAVAKSINNKQNKIWLNLTPINK